MDRVTEEATFRSRLVEALDNTAAEVERLRLLKEYELGVFVETGPDGNPRVEELPRSAE